MQKKCAEYFVWEIHWKRNNKFRSNNWRNWTRRRQWAIRYRKRSHSWSFDYFCLVQEYFMSQRMVVFDTICEWLCLFLHAVWQKHCMSAWWSFWCNWYIRIFSQSYDWNNWQVEATNGTGTYSKTFNAPFTDSTSIRTLWVSASTLPVLSLSKETAPFSFTASISNPLLS